MRKFSEKISALQKGIFFLCLSGLFFSIMNIFVNLSGPIPSIEKSFFRNMVSAILVFTYILCKNKQWSVNTDNLPYLLLRSLAGTVGIVCNFYAVSNMNLSDAVMLSKLSPFMAMIFSYLLLKEKLYFRQILYIILAFASTLLVIKPGFDFDGVYPALIALFGGVCAGLAYTFVRKLSILNTPAPTIVLFFSLFSSVCTFFPALVVWEDLLPLQLFYLLGAGCFAFLAQISITKAYSYAPASEISVYDYGQIIYSMILVFIIFGDVPDILSISAYVLIFIVAYLNYLFNIKIKYKK